MEKHEIIRPNIFYATFSQFIQIFVYFFIAFIIYKIFVFILDFEIIPFIIETIKMIDIEIVDIIIEFVIDNIHASIIFLATPIILLLVNIVNEKVEVEVDKIVLKTGFIKIKREEFLQNEIIRYEVEKDFGILPSGTIEIFTVYGDKIKIDYVLNLKKASIYLEELIQKNRVRTKQMHQQNINKQDGKNVALENKPANTQ